MKNKKRTLRIISALAVIALLAVLARFFQSGSDAGLHPGALGKLYPDAFQPTYTGERMQPSEAAVETGQNESLRLLYDSSPPAVLVKDIRNGFVWSSAYDMESYDGEADEYAVRGMSVLCQIVYTDFESVTNLAGSNDAGVETAAELLKNGVCLTFSFVDCQISVSMEIWLDDGGLNVRIPQEKIREDGEFALLSVDVLPAFGASSNKENGYMVYPDGSGALYRYKEQMMDIPARAYQDIYSPMLFDYDEIDSRRRQEQKSVMLPVFGIKKEQNAMAGYVCQGDDSGYIQLQPSGYGYMANRINAGITYRKTYKFQTPDGSEEYQVEKDKRTGDFGVKYFFTCGENADYSGMAGQVREYLLKSGRMKRSAILDDPKLPVSIELFVGAREQTMLWENYVMVTSFKECGEILSDLKTHGDANYIASLLGWQKEGYGKYPAHLPPAGAAGGERGLGELGRFARESGISLLLSENLTRAAAGTKGFSKQKEAIYSVNNLPVSDRTGERFFLNPYRQLLKLKDALLPAYKKLAAGLALEDAAGLVYDDYNRAVDLTRRDTIAAYMQMASSVRSEMGMAAVQGGNAYMLGLADFLYNVPDTGSGNPLFDESIPFYQLVVHGSAAYSSHIPLNMSYDTQEQKLRLVEYGSLPYYVLTKDDPVTLKDSYANAVFTSRYDLLKKDIRSTVQEFGTRLEGLYGQAMVGHRSIGDGVKAVVYQDGTTVYINYGGTGRTVEGVGVGPMDYTVRAADGTIR